MSESVLLWTHLFGASINKFADVDWLIREITKTNIEIKKDKKDKIAKFEKM